MKDLGILHCLKTGASSELPSGPDLFQWQTCLRSLAFYYGRPPEGLDSQIEIFKGELAYQRLLEIICGYHSPLFGETEVMGQFKKLVLESDFNHLSWGREARRFFQGLLTDAKSIRQKYLVGLGSQSYGSLVRKFVKPYSRVAVLGFGQLGKEILPWIEKSKKEVTVWTRHLAAKKDLTHQCRGVAFKDWRESPSSEEYDAVVVVAPHSTSEVHQFLASLKSGPQLVIDLREESRQEPLCTSWAQMRLDEVFSEVEKTKNEIALLKKQVLKEIELLTQKRFESFEVRPFGWEDICA